MAKMAMPDPAAILIALKAKGKMKQDALGSDKDPAEGGDDEGYDHDEHLQEIADDMLKAISDKDSVKLKELLQEAFECMERAPHDEAE